MSLNSFKKSSISSRLWDRTPSPPRDAYEPLSPTDVLAFQRSYRPSPIRNTINNKQSKLASQSLQENQTQSKKSRNVSSHTRTDSQHSQTYRPRTSHSQVSESPINALASAASSVVKVPTHEGNIPSQGVHYTGMRIAPSPRNLQSNKRRAGTHDERPNKRARSEMLVSPMHINQPSRPMTSHAPPTVFYNVEQMAEQAARMRRDPRRLSEVEEKTRRQEAELLLFFNQTASFRKSPPLSVSHANILVTRASEEAIENSPESEKGSPQTAVQTQTPPDDSCAGAESRNQEVDSKSTENSDISKILTETPGSSEVVKGEKETTQAQDMERASRHSETPAPDQLHSPKSLGNDEVDLILPESTDEQIPRIHRASEFKSTAPNRRKSEATAYKNRLAISGPNDSTSSRGISVPPDNAMLIREIPLGNATSKIVPHEVEPVTMCPSCNISSSLDGEMKNWIECSGCKQWFHFACAGFANDREVARVDKFYCGSCKQQHGPTTYLRKSKRAHTAVDYAGLNQGVVRTPDDTPEHHYIQHFKDGSFKFDPENFPRMRPELLSLDYFEKSGCFTEPIVIPASLNPRPGVIGQNSHTNEDVPPVDGNTDPLDDYEYETYPDDGQDKLDMVIPQGLTVRRVAELYGPHEPVEVIEVKSQEGSDKKWDMNRWADYYEDTSDEKIIRNVISLEVSQSKLGRLIRRPKVVRDMDLQDSVWPQEEIDRGNLPKVQFYCLMSVGDAFTDFHIDFGGSSVFYHVLKGRKTFFFIPPKPKHLKKYEEWCLSPAQNWTWLGDQTNECYRVDLFPGDTMLIPSGWIHAVWTPENSLVIGGNFLTKMHFDMQIKVAEIEKATKVARKFRYPHFQKVLWYAVLKYLEEDPLPQNVAQLFYERKRFVRTTPIYFQTNSFGHNSVPGPENYNARYYSKQEMNSLPALVRFIHRTVMISLGKIENITVEVRNAVAKSIPKGRGDPLEIIKTFAAWTAWKRGNEELPDWAHPDAVLPNIPDIKGEKKIATRKQPERKNSDASHSTGFLSEQQQAGLPPAPFNGYVNPVTPSGLAKHLSTPKTSQLGPKRIACDACRKRRIRCKHKDAVVNGDISPPSSRTLDVVQPYTIPAAPLLASSPESSKSRILSLPTPSTGDSLMRSAQEALSFDGTNGIMGHSESADGKKGRNKACVDCRRSKRRCIHDESGAIDPVKAQEAKIPRGTTSHKKRRYMEIVERSQRQGHGPDASNSGSFDESSPEDVKMTNGMDTTYPVQTPDRPTFEHLPDGPHFDQVMGYEDNEPHDDFDRNYEDFVVSSIEEQHVPEQHAQSYSQDLIADAAIDPSLAATDFNPPQTPQKTVNEITVSPPLSEVNGTAPHTTPNGMNLLSNHPYYAVSTPRPGSSGVAGPSPKESNSSASKRTKSGSASRKEVKAFRLQGSPSQLEPELPKTEAGMEEERSLKLAKELQEMDWGLRRRRGSRPSS